MQPIALSNNRLKRGEQFLRHCDPVSFGELRDFVSMWRGTSHEVLLLLQSSWARDGMQDSFPAWAQPWYAINMRCCARLNHKEGFGCGLSKNEGGCSRVHSCVYCDGGGHGIYTGKCPKLRLLKRQLVQFMDDAQVRWQKGSFEHNIGQLWYLANNPPTPKAAKPTTAARLPKHATSASEEDSAAAVSSTEGTQNANQTLAQVPIDAGSGSQAAVASGAAGLDAVEGPPAQAARGPGHQAAPVTMVASPFAAQASSSPLSPASSTSASSAPPAADSDSDEEERDTGHRDGNELTSDDDSDSEFDSGEQEQLRMEEQMTEREAMWEIKLSSDLVLQVDLRKRGIIDESPHATVREGKLFLASLSQDAEPSFLANMAVKLVRLPDTQSFRKAVLQDLRKEAAILQSMGQTHSDVVVAVKEHGQTKIQHKLAVGDFYYLVMARMEQNLAQWLQTPNLRFTQHQLADLVLQLLRAYHACHTRTISDNAGGHVRAPLYHRDVKPQNILVNQPRPDSSHQLLLCDFAFSTLVEGRQSSKQRKTYVGTVELLKNGKQKVQRHWVAPEVSVTDVERCYDLAPADVWALGAVLYFLGSGGHALFRTLEEVRCTSEDERRKLLERDGMHCTQPLLLHLVDLMTKPSPADRLPLSAALHHPCTWTSAEVLHFLWQLDGLVKSEPVDGMEPTRDVLKEVQKSDRFSAHWPQAIQTKHWFDRVCGVDKVQGGPEQMLRELRNVQQHIADHIRKHNLAGTFGELQRKFEEDVVAAYPDFIALLWEKLLAGGATLKREHHANRGFITVEWE